MATKSSKTKRKRGRPAKDAAIPDSNNGEGEGFGTITQVSSVESDDDESLVDPSLFEELDIPRIPHLEAKARKFAKQSDKAKTEKTLADGLEDECLLIMADNNIESYDRHGVHLKIDRKPKLKITIE